MQRDQTEFDSRDIHGQVVPNDVRDSDRVLARARERNAEKGFQEVRVWRLSPLGIEIVQPEDPSSAFSIGQSVDLELIIAGNRSALAGLVVDVVEGAKDTQLVGIRLTPIVEVSEGKNRRASSRWLCSDQFFPTCMAATPGKFDDYIYFQVRDVSEDGLQLMCSLRNKFLMPSMRLALTAVFPMGNVVAINVEITRVGVVSEGVRDRLIVGSRFVNLGAPAKSALGQYLIQFSGDASPRDLRESGFAPQSVALGVDFYNLKSEADYKEVLALRHAAHLLDGNIDESVSVEQMGDINDTRARILVGRYAGKIVATARIRFNDIDEPLEHEEHLVWPAEMPRRDQIVEISRVATDPDFRRSDLLAALFRMCYVNSLQPERPWVVISCLDHMVKFYERIGFDSTGLSHVEPLWSAGRTLNVMIVNTADVVLGRGVNPFVWNYVWKDVADVLIESGVVNPTGLDRVRLKLYRFLSPFSGLIKFRRSSPPKHRKKQ